MTERNAAEEFNASLDAVLARVPAGRIQIALQIVSASVGAGDLEELRRDLDKLPEASPSKKALGDNWIAKQIVAAGPQLIALDLDRTTPLRILGIGWPTVTVLFGAKSLGHEVIVVCDVHEVNDRLLKLYDVPRFKSKAPDDLPRGPFDLIMVPGNLSLGTKRGWAQFVQPLAHKLTGDGRIFVPIAKTPYPKRNYYPDVVISKLARLGVRVSSKNHFVLLDKALIGKFESEAPSAEESDELLDLNDDPAGSEDQIDIEAPVAADRDAGGPAAPVSAGDQKTGRTSKPLWKIGAALVFGSVLSAGFWVATWASRGIDR